VSSFPAELRVRKWDLAVAALALGVAFTLGSASAAVEWDRLEPAEVAAFGLVPASMLYWHRYRGLGLAAIALIGAFAASWFAMPLATSLLAVAFLRITMFLGLQVAMIAALGFSFLGLHVGDARFVSGIVAVLGVVVLARPLFEFSLEPILWFMYRIRGVGPGLANMPARGPCIVIANHASWFDPLFLEKALPRPITPMMLSRFHDLPLLRILLKLFRTIRVPDQRYKTQETPDEVLAAIAALDRGDCLVLFPEGFLRRDEGQPLRRFGRGVWQILAARPETPIFCCWIEGGWGSYFSHFNGNPTKNKRFDVRRRIAVAVPNGIRVDATLLAEHLATRLHLMGRVTDARRLLE